MRPLERRCAATADASGIAPDDIAGASGEPPVAPAASSAPRELGGGLVPQCRVALEAAGDQRVDRGVDVGTRRADRGCRSRHARDRRRHLGVAAEREVTDEHLVEQEPDGVHVGAGVARAPLDLLGREVARGADDGAGPREVARARRLRDAEVGDLDRTFGRDEDVRGLDVAVDDPVAVRVVECGGHLARHAQRFGDGERAVVVDDAAQRGAVDELHDDVGDVVVLARVVGRDDVGVSELGGGDRLAPEPGPQPVVERQLGVEGLDRDATRQEDVVADPYGGHPATSDRADEPVAVTEDTPG